MKVPFFKHNLSSEYGNVVANVLSTPFITSAGVGKQVETLLCDYFSVKHAFLTNSWTNGALATLLAMDIGPGDEVIVPAQTFIATSNVVELCGAKPVFVDVDEQTLLMTKDGIKNAITPKTKAVIIVHLYGQMCKSKEIYTLLREKNIRLIEDSAHCFEGQRENYKSGQYSDAAIFSFYATKNITCGEGGAIITNDGKLALKIQQTRLHGMSATASERFTKGKYNHWDMERLGVKANLPDILACLLPEQIRHVDENKLVRQKLANNYRTILDTLNIRTQTLEPGIDSAEHLFPIWVPPNKRDTVIKILNDNDIQVAVNYRSVPTLSYYREKYGFKGSDHPASYNWGNGTITLPLYPSLEERHQQYIEHILVSKIAPFLSKY